MMENKWKEVANLFGLELNEIFNIDCSSDDYLFNENGLQFLTEDKEPLDEDWEVLMDLFKGKTKVIEKPWKPKTDEFYWTYEDGETINLRWDGIDYDYFRWKAGNCFKTKEEAETKGKELMEQIKKEYEKS